MDDVRSPHVFPFGANHRTRGTSSRPNQVGHADGPRSQVWPWRDRAHRNHTVYTYGVVHDQHIGERPPLLTEADKSTGIRYAGSGVVATFTCHSTAFQKPAQTRHCTTNFSPTCPSSRCLIHWTSHNKEVSRLWISFPGSLPHLVAAGLASAEILGHSTPGPRST